MIAKNPSSLSSTVKADEKPARGEGKPYGETSSPRWTMLNRFVEETARRLTPGAVTVWLILYKWADVDGSVKMTQDQIAERSPFGTRQVIEHLNTLMEHKCLTMISRGSRNKGPSRYRISSGSTCGIPQPLPDYNMRKPALCNMRNPAHTPERKETPIAALAASAEELRLKTVPNGVGFGI